MDFTQRPAAQPVNNQPAPQHPAHHNGRANKKVSAWFNWSLIILLFSATILAVALLIYIAIGGPRSESKYINKDDYQAIFLNGGQVYFGKLTTLNDKFLRIGDIYYLRVNQQVQPNQSSSQTNPNDVSLVKLGCELHGPTDEMLINRDQVIFWENLKNDGQVTKAIDQYKKQNPNGQNCSQSSSTPTSNSSSNTTPTAPTTPTNNSSSSNKKQ